MAKAGRRDELDVGAEWTGGFVLRIARDGQPTAPTVDVLLAFETVPGPQTGSGFYEQLGSVPVTGSEVCS